ncbi:MAG: hypothetical protein ABJB86_20710 [Bacteroidota bacterium]
MNSKIANILLLAALIIFTKEMNAQVYRTATTDALENNGQDWIEKKLPPSIITFSDYSGVVEIKTPISPLFIQNLDSVSFVRAPADTMANFTMTLDKQQVQQQQITLGKNFTTAGILTINNISKTATAQYLLTPRNNPADGFSISVVIRFKPADYGMKITGASENTPLIVRVSSDYLNKFKNNY